MKATNAFSPRRNIRQVQAGWAVILISALTALGVASAITAAGASDGIGLALGLIAGAALLIAGEVWIHRAIAPGTRRHAAPRAADSESGAVTARVVAESRESVHETQEARPGGVVWVSPYSPDAGGGYRHAGTYLHERLDRRP